LPAAGDIVIFDRGWDNRAGVQRVMGFCTDDEARWFLKAAPPVEKEMVNSGIILVQSWLEVSAEDQARRLEECIDDAREIWTLSPMGLICYSWRYYYSRARDEMLQATDTSWAPWFMAHSHDKRRARLNIITHLLGRIPYKKVPRPKIKLPKRQKPGGYKEPDYPYKAVPETF